MHKVRAGSLPAEGMVLVGWKGSDQVKLEKCKAGVVYAVQTKRQRNPAHHDLVMAFLRGMFANQEQYKDFDVYRAHVKLKCAWVYDEPLISEDTGAVQWVVRPTDWGNCGEDEFSEFHDKLKAYAGENFGWEFVAQYESI